MFVLQAKVNHSCENDQAVKQIPAPFHPSAELAAAIIPQLQNQLKEKEGNASHLQRCPKCAEVGMIKTEPDDHSIQANHNSGDGLQPINSTTSFWFLINEGC
mmetsp:Transcript_131433/g.262244  ORF Transcript_131433/g.262244 Transcript_131433/m.262244 type:complete len:102 (-) Transcript_131433:508-813(-)